MPDFINQLVLEWKYAGVALLAVFLPAEAVLPLALFAIPESPLSLPGIIISATIGATMGSTAVYLIARRVGPEAVYELADRHGAWLGMTKAGIDRAGRRFDKHAGAAVLMSKFVPGLRTAVSVPAGLRGMPLPRFLAYTAAGSGIWFTFLALSGLAARLTAETLAAAL